MPNKYPPEPGDFWRIGNLHAHDPASMLSIWTIYRPVPGGEHYVAIRFEVGGKTGVPITTESKVGSKSLEVLRDFFMRQGLTCLARSEFDADNVVESWL